MKTSMKSLLKTCLVCAAFTVTAKAQNSGSSTFPRPSETPATASEIKPHVGLLLGMVAPEGSYNQTTEYGIDTGFQPSVPFAVGAEATYWRANAKLGPDLERTAVLLKGAYNLGGTMPVIRYSYVGAGVGPVFKSDGTGVALAPLLGFDIPVTAEEARRLSVGAAAKYALMDGSDADALSVNAVLKYWY